MGISFRPFRPIAPESERSNGRWRDLPPKCQVGLYLGAWYADPLPLTLVVSNDMRFTRLKVISTVCARL